MLPSWFSVNNWHQLVHYAVSPACANAGNVAGCGSTNALTVGTSTAVRALVIASGSAIGSQMRPCAAAADCLDDAETLNGDSIFVTPTSSATNNDRLAIVAP